MQPFLTASYRKVVPTSISLSEQITARTRDRFICVAEATNGHARFAVVAKNKLFQFWDVIPQLEGVSEVDWFVSDRKIFENYPVADLLL